MDFITIDFETANSRLDSACSIGIVGVKNGKIVLQESHLIQPNQEFSAYNTSIHHLTEEDCKDALPFDLLWNNIHHYFIDVLVFAHNASFDIGVLRALFARYEINNPVIRFGCTVQIGRKLWNGILPNCKLHTISSHLAIKHNHHEALSDAKACAEILLYAMKMRSCDDVEQLYSTLGLRFGFSSQTQFYNTYTPYTRKRSITLVDDPKLMDKVIGFCGKPTLYTRKEWTALLLSHGAYVENAINYRTDYFIALGNCPKDKLMRATELKNRGASFGMLSEDELFLLIR